MIADAWHVVFVCSLCGMTLDWSDETGSIYVDDEVAHQIQIVPHTCDDDALRDLCRDGVTGELNEDEYRQVRTEASKVGWEEPMEGWCCPSCGSCYAPHVDRCTVCGPTVEVRDVTDEASTVDAANGDVLLGVPCTHPRRAETTAGLRCDQCGTLLRAGPPSPLSDMA